MVCVSGLHADCINCVVPLWAASRRSFSAPAIQQPWESRQPQFRRIRRVQPAHRVSSQQPKPLRLVFAANHRPSGSSSSGVPVDRRTTASARASQPYTDPSPQAVFLSALAKKKPHGSAIVTPFKRPNSPPEAATPQLKPRENIPIPAGSFERPRMDSRSSLQSQTRGTQHLALQQNQQTLSNQKAASGIPLHPTTPSTTLPPTTHRRSSGTRVGTTYRPQQSAQPAVPRTVPPPVVMPEPAAAAGLPRNTRSSTPLQPGLHFPNRAALQVRLHATPAACCSLPAFRYTGSCTYVTLFAASTQNLAALPQAYQSCTF
jgi:hypothetical protein